MDHKKIDKLLTRLPSIVKENYPSLKFSADMREAVHQRISEQEFSIESKSHQSFFKLSFAAVFITFLLLGGITSLFLGGNGQKNAVHSAITQVESKTIDLDGDGIPEMVNTWKIKEEEETEEKLVALIWAKDSKDQWQVVSSEPMDGGEFLPLEVLKPQQRRGNLVIISAARGKENVSYRVMGYNGQDVMPFLDRSLDYSPKQGRMIQEIESLLPVTFEK